MGGVIVPNRDLNGNIINLNSPFASKRIAEGNLFKRVTGHKFSVNASETKNLDMFIPFPVVKFSGADIFGGAFGDQVDFLVLDTLNNAVSGLDPATYGNHVQLNQFGFDVVLPGPSYSNKSDYDADLVGVDGGMIVRCVYKNSEAVAKDIAINLELHEVKQ